MENAMKEFKDELAAYEREVQAELKEAVNELKSTTEQPREYDFGKDLKMKLFVKKLELQAESQRNQDEYKEFVKGLEARKEWIKNTMKFISDHQRYNRNCRKMFCYVSLGLLSFVLFYF
ncbi:hypothetical protein RchiOBHm_Chr7g0203281 [Rosa chinensis]|uniref:Uncharacterized protein n=1 Tax=Rosa chinensis TaxID=74649 RepID=A0A2P6P8E1_ROSCH|nr:hypothetical protein RchiOBHm_Chr7g0203281 [Rosa chinensis]